MDEIKELMNIFLEFDAVYRLMIQPILLEMVHGGIFKVIKKNLINHRKVPSS